MVVIVQSSIRGQPLVQDDGAIVECDAGSTESRGTFTQKEPIYE